MCLTSLLFYVYSSLDFKNSIICKPLAASYTIDMRVCGGLRAHQFVKLLKRSENTFLFVMLVVPNLKKCTCQLYDCTMLGSNDHLCYKNNY